MNRDFPKLLSVIVPVYNQGSTIRKNIQGIVQELELFNTPYELIIVDDGSWDNSVQAVKKMLSSKIKIIGYKTNKGKGYAVRFGMAKAKGDVIGFIDAGGEIRESGIPMLIEHMRWYNADIVIGSKRHPVSKISYPWYRKILSFGYQMLIKVLFGLNIRDSQVGLKLYKRSVLEDVLPRLLVKEFAFDIEILAVSKHLGYDRIFESPIELDFKQVTSNITPKRVFSTIFRMTRDTLAVFYRLRILKYYDEGNHRKWRYDPELNFRVNTG